MKVYIHYAEMDTLLVHITNDKPIFTPDKTLDDVASLASEFACIPNRDVLISRGEGIDLVKLCCELHALGDCHISDGERFA